MKRINWWRISVVVWSAVVIKFAALDIIHDIDAELDRQEVACKVPAVVVRRTK